MTNEELWQAALNEIELTITKANFITWFKHTNIVHNEGGAIIVSVPNAFTKEWLENKYHKFIIRSLRANNPEVRSVSYSISTTHQRQQVTPDPFLLRKRPAPDAPGEEQLDFQEFNVDKETNLNPRYTFSNFIVGSFNEL